MAQNDYCGLEHGVLQYWAPAPKAEQARRYGRKTTTYESSYYPPSVQYRENSRSIQSQRAQRRRHQPNRAAAAGLGGSGMQAIFLGSNQKSTGTGVFLPRRSGIDPKFSKKPVHALNLNVLELGQIIKPQPGEPKNGTVKGTDEKSENSNEKDEDARLSPDIFLPEEWTY